VSTKLLADWTPEPQFVPQLRESTGGKGSRSSLQRWRREDTVPAAFEWMKVGRVIFWRERKELEARGRDHRTA
jgi:hypothetical protein